MAIEVEGKTLDQALREFESRLIAQAMNQAACNKTRAAETLGITATRLKALGLVDKIVTEPVGGAHRDPPAMTQNLRKALQEAWRQLRDKAPDELVAARFDRLIGYGKFKEVESGR